MPPSLSQLIIVISFYLNDNGGTPGLCLLDAVGAAQTSRCTFSACPYPTCSCKWLTACPSGAVTFNVPAQSNNVENPVSPYYPDDATCCVAGKSMREQMVTDNYLDCSVGRPCAVTPFGATDTSILYAFLFSMTSTIPPQISGMTSVTKLYEWVLPFLSSSRQGGVLSFIRA